MIVLSIEEFTAKRRKSQDDEIAKMEPLALDYIKAFGAGSADERNAIISAASDLYERTYKSEGGEGSGNSLRALGGVRELIRNTDSESDANTLAIAIVVSIQNAATVQAAAEDPEPLVMEWVTMHDGGVRPEHKAVEGQQRPVGEKFDVDGEEMPYPGYPGVPIKLWINCRCTLAPAVQEDIAASANVGQTVPEQEVTMSDDDTQEEPMTAVPWYGVLAPEGKWSGDGRMFAEGALSHRDLPLPLTYQKVSDDGHNGSVTVAKIEQAFIVDGEFRACGHFLLTPEADEAVGMIADFGKFGVSVDADDAEFEFDEETLQVTFTKARVSAASIVSIPAFAEAYVTLGESPEGFMPDIIEWDDEALAASLIPFKRGPGWITNPEDTKRLHDYWTKPGEPGYAKIAWGEPGDFNRCRVLVGEKIAVNSPEDTRFLNQICAQWHKDALGIWPGEHKAAADVLTDTVPGPAVSLVASLRGHRAPAEWFEDPVLTKPTALRVTKEGRVYGHLAQWGVCHLGYSKVCVTAPEETSYANFLNGEVLTTNDEFIPVGHLVSGGEHAPDHMTRAEAAHYYGSTSAVVADVTCGNDEHGIWVAGWVRPGATDEQVTALRASTVSGDWRRIGGQLSLIIGLAVNSGGLPVHRVAASVRNGEQWSLTAAGVVHDEPTQADLDYDKIAEAVLVAMDNRKSRAEKMAALKERFNQEEKV